MSASNEAIRQAFNDTASALTQDPAKGIGTAKSKVRLKAGELKCDIEEGAWRFTADMSKQVGGGGSAPNPGVYGRGALGSCIAITYMMHAAHLGIPVNGIEVEIETDYDDGAFFGVSSAMPGYQAVRYAIAIDSPAPESELLRLMDHADAHCPFLDIFRRAQSCTRSWRRETLTTR